MSSRTLPNFLNPAVRAAARKEKGGAPEDARRGNAMLSIDKPIAESKAEMPSLFTETNVNEARRAAAWFQDRVARAAKEGPFTETVALSPVLAEILLANNPDNRNLRERAVNTYAEDIRNGNWALNGEGIKVSEEGLLNDGQHRCHAVIRAGRAIKTFISFGLERDSRFTVDQGAARSSGNYLAMSGIKNPNEVAAVAGMLWRYEVLGTLDSSRGGPTKVQVYQVVEANPDITTSVEAIPSSARNIRRSRSVLAFCHLLFARRARTHADAFILRLCLGDGLTRRDPIFWCRERLMTEAKMRAHEKAELIIRTWNAYRRGAVQTKSSPITGELPRIER